eukprot:TRINITY_DN8597_c0_g2_i1.p2 TRINITY_DN8597_c0_g2~~TRINITY_DN8597_c0_g2_i1.p2  ORF type:complete len:155 (-),score=30.48 TRINITY_DN8597_c0_g2_i1:60-524(-)
MALPETGIYVGAYADTLDNPGASDRARARSDSGNSNDEGETGAGFTRTASHDSYDAQDQFHARTEYTLKVEDDGNFLLTRHMQNDALPTLDDMEDIAGQLTECGEGSYTLTFRSTVSEKMKLSRKGDDWCLRALAEAAGPGASPGEQDMTMRKE